MTKIYSTGKSPNVKTAAIDEAIQPRPVVKTLQDYQKEIILLFDQGIGGVDVARGVLTQGSNSDVLPRYIHDGLAGALAHLLRGRELVEEMFGLQKICID